MSCRTRRASSTAAAAAKAAATIRPDAAPADAAAVDRAAADTETQHGTREPMKPRIAITEGDPAGIGPEIARKAAADPRVLAVCEPVLYGAPPGATFQPGVLSAGAGKAAYDIIVLATDGALQQTVSGIATAPINKEALRLAGFPWNGHTDLLAHLTGAEQVAMMLFSDPLRVVRATVPVRLAVVPALPTETV